MARCPSCDDALTATVHEGVALSLCNDCGGTWATAKDLEALHDGPVEIVAAKGTTRHRCASCRVTMSKARLDDRVDVERCLTCGGVFFAEGKLKRFAPGRSKQLQVTGARHTFGCVRCGKDFPIEEGTALPRGFPPSSRLRRIGS